MKLTVILSHLVIVEFHFFNDLVTFAKYAVKVNGTPSESGTVTV